MNIAELRLSLNENKKELRRILPIDLLCGYNEDELDVMAFILNTTQCLETAVKVANCYKGNKIATR